MITIKGLSRQTKSQGPKDNSIEEEFRYIWTEVPTYAEHRYDLAKEFFTLGRESARVFVKIEGGVAETMVSDGVKVAVLDYDDEDSHYKHVDPKTDLNCGDCGDRECYCDPMTDDERLERVPEEFRGLKNVQGERY